MKEKMLRENGGTKVYIIIIAVLVILCIALGAFAVINMNKDKEDDEKTSKKNETNTSKVIDNDTKNKTRDDDDEDDDEDNSVQKYTGTFDITQKMGTDGLEDTVWTLTVEGDDDTLSKMVMKAELGKYFKETYDDLVGTSDAYTYEEFVELIHEELDSTMGSLGTEMATEMATELGISSSKVKSNVSWVDDETLEIEIDLSKVKRSDYKSVDEDESVIEFVVDSLEEQDIKMKKSK